MSSEEQWLKVLIVGPASETLQTVRLLLGSMGCQCLLASDVRQALTLIPVENPRAAILDANAVDFAPAPSASVTDQLCSELQGRVIVFSEEPVAGELEVLSQYFELPQVHPSRLVHELWPKLQSVARRPALREQIRYSALLVFDSIFSPAAAGLRGARPPGRRLLFRFGSLLADLSIEPQPDSNHLAVSGQIADSANPHLHLDERAVSLCGRKGTLASTKTNAFGEFQLDFPLELDAAVEIDIRQGERFVAALPLSIPARRTATT